MKPIEFTLSERAQRELLAFAQQEAQQVEFPGYGDPFAPHPSNDPALRMRYKIKLMGILNLDAEGSATLHALEHICDKASDPFIVVKNLPVQNASEAEQRVMLECFRQYIHDLPDYDHLQQCEDTYIKDKGDDASVQKRGGFTQLHIDPKSVTCNLMSNEGANPRPTIVLSPEEFAEHAAQTIGKNTSSRDILDLLSKPIWHFHCYKNTRHPEGHKEGGQPILTYSPHVAEHNPHLTPYHFAHIKIDLPPVLDGDSAGYKALSFSEKQNAKALHKGLRKLMKNPVDNLEGHFCSQGDLAIFDNSRVIHAGGEYLYQTPQEYQNYLHSPASNKEPRTLRCADLDTGDTDTTGQLDPDTQVEKFFAERLKAGRKSDEVSAPSV